MPFIDFTTQGTNDNAVIHEFFGPARLGMVEGLPQDVPHRSTPLVGTGSLQMQFLQQHLRGHIYHTAASQRGWPSGYILTQWYADMIAESPASAFGLYCYGSQVDLLTAGNAYLFGCATKLAGGGNPQSLFLAKTSAGLGMFPDTMTLLDSANNQWDVLETFLTKLSWMQTPTSVILEGYIGVQPDGSDLALVVAYEDTSPLTSPVVEGLWAGQTTAVAVKVYADETAFFEGMA